MDGIMGVGGHCSGSGTFPLLIRGGLLKVSYHVERSCTEPYTCFLDLNY